MDKNKFQRTDVKKELELFLFLNGWKKRNSRSWLHNYKDSFLSMTTDAKDRYLYYLFSTDFDGTGDRSRSKFKTTEELLEFLFNGY